MAQETIARRTALRDMQERRLDLIDKLAHMSPMELIVSPMDVPQTRRTALSVGQGFIVIERKGVVYVGLKSLPDLKGAPRGKPIG